MAPEATSAPSKAASTSLKDELAAALPASFTSKIRYIRSPSKPCEPLFSALPGQESEKTKLASQFLSVSVNSASLSHLDVVTSGDAGSDVISFAIEALVYSTKRLTTIFVSKVDSTPFTPRIKPSPIKTSVTTFLRWLAEQERRRHPKRKTVISLFARAQAQYLFPGSSDDKTKHVLDDRQLIKWWARVLDPIIPSNVSEGKADIEHQAYLTVPCYADTELTSFMPPGSTPAAGQPRWLPGNPLLELARTRGIPEHAPPRCLLPRFPDDPKARFMQDLDEEIGINQDSQVTVSPTKKRSGRWNSVRDLDRFWEAMEFRQECSSGRVVGFLWLVISPKGSDDEAELEAATSSQANSQDSLASISTPAPSSDPMCTDNPSKPTAGSPKKRRRKPLTGPIIPRQPRLKGGSSSLSNLAVMQAEVNAQAGDGLLVSKDGYDKAMQTLLHLDFANLQGAVRSTAKWVAEIRGIAGLSGDMAVEVVGSAKTEAPPAAPATNGSSTVNDLGGMIRKKKRKAADEVLDEAHAVAEKGQEAAGTGQPVVNVLGGGMIRKKPKPAAS
ncbi:hypothetical protein M409DRAFT_51346 [Zasmidium cellare ATCC 36951]|uniref:histone acetyltransferase n=1 Tax=Zasmidium cellare ATCC 36951 TaxID=1080233 RepID=A0A6A6CWP7_ZASCE|nr:uncharacterized protein M409DRAFT_51346 [Zasmidium cellare ATCC 36951]KAF2171133.1 hypothetical protein M409DRAFT_51346 [Zasmidium cellare ATCC 36951]